MTTDDLIAQASRSNERSVSDLVRTVVLAGYGPGDRWTIPELAERVGSREDTEAIVTSLLANHVLERVKDRDAMGWVEWRLTDRALESADGIHPPIDKIAEGGYRYVWNTVFETDKRWQRGKTLHRVRFREGSYTETACGVVLDATDDEVQGDRDDVEDRYLCGRCFRS